MDGCDEEAPGVPPGCKYSAGCKGAGGSVGVAPTPGLVVGLEGRMNGGSSGVGDDGLSPSGLLGGLSSNDTGDGVSLGVLLPPDGPDGCDIGEGEAPAGTGTCLGGSC